VSLSVLFPQLPILEKNHARRYLKVRRIARPEQTFKQNVGALYMIPRRY
jgi:hypothetical protein